MGAIETALEWFYESKVGACCCWALVCLIMGLIGSSQEDRRLTVNDVRRVWRS